MTRYDSSMSHSIEMVGGVIPGLSSVPDKQPYKFGGKELTTANGLNEYDFGARQYWQAVPGFTSIDPCAADYIGLSPYID